MNRWRNHNPRIKALGLWLLVMALAGLVFMLPPIPQPLAYHDFADKRDFGMLPYYLNTASNLLFVLTGAVGLLFLLSKPGGRAFIDQREARPYALFFFAVILIGFASGFYHLAPDNERLVWDRAAIGLAFMAWFAAIVCERVNLKTGLFLLPLLAAAGLATAFLWGLSEAQGRGDLRAYGLMQLTPVLLVPLLILLYPPRYSGGRSILAVIGLYLLALLFDLTDNQVFALTDGLLSGHTIKHIIAALVPLWIVRYLGRRRVL